MCPQQAAWHSHTSDVSPDATLRAFCVLLLTPHITFFRTRLFFVAISQVGKLKFQENLSNLPEVTQQVIREAGFQSACELRPKLHATLPLLHQPCVMIPTWQTRERRPEDRKNLLALVEELDPNPQLGPELSHLSRPCLPGASRLRERQIWMFPPRGGSHQQAQCPSFPAEVSLSRWAIAGQAHVVTSRDQPACWLQHWDKRATGCVTLRGLSLKRVPPPPHTTSPPLPCPHPTVLTCTSVSRLKAC